jgi:hypothetical protein
VSSLGRNARIAGLLYLGVVLLGPVRLIYIPSVLFVGLADVPIYFINTLNDFRALLFARGADSLAAFAQPQLDAMVIQYLNLHHYGVVVNSVFWGAMATAVRYPRL